MFLLLASTSEYFFSTKTTHLNANYVLNINTVINIDF